MFKLVVLSALVAVAVAKPSGWGHGLELAPIVTNTYISPAAVSSTYRRDIISKPAITYAAPALAYAAPVVQKTIVAAPVAYAAPAAVSHSYRSDIISRPLYTKTLVAPATYSYAHAPSVVSGYTPTLYAGHASGIYAARSIHGW